jgi:hypothetical protein
MKENLYSWREVPTVGKEVMGMPDILNRLDTIHTLEDHLTTIKSS